MSERKKLIDEEIKLMPLRRNYYTISSYDYCCNKKTEKPYAVNESSPAGIAGKKLYSASEKPDTRTSGKKPLFGVTHNNSDHEHEHSTETPTAAPAETPTAAPAETPTAAPAETPTAAPAETPTAAPAETPTAAPAETPTAAPAETPVESGFPSLVRFYSLLPSGEDLNIILRGRTVLPNIGSAIATQFIQLEPGMYELSYYVTHNTNSLSEYQFQTFSGDVKTLVFVKSEDGYHIIDLHETANDCYENAAYVRFIQSSPSAPAMDIYIDDTTVILGILPDEISEFIGLTSGRHTIKITAAATSIIYIEESFNFPERSANNLFIVSDNNGGYSFYLLTNTDACL